MVIKKARADLSTTKIGNIDADFLLKHMPELVEDVAETLCIRFKDLVLPLSFNTNDDTGLTRKRPGRILEPIIDENVLTLLDKNEDESPEPF